MRAVVVRFCSRSGRPGRWGRIGFPEAQAQRPAAQERAVSSLELTTLSYDAGDGRQQITVVDPRQRVMAVYHVDRATGGLGAEERAQRRTGTC